MSDARLLLLVVITPSSSPGLFCQLLIAVGLAVPPLPALDRSGPRRTSTASSWSQWACGPRRTSTGESLSAVGLAGLQPDPNGQKQSHIECQRERQIECQKICQVECHKIWQIECQKICQVECHKIWQIECQKIWQTECQMECQIECQKICQIECQKVCQIECQKICQIECQKICQTECQMGWIECHGGDHSKQSNFSVVLSSARSLCRPCCAKPASHICASQRRRFGWSFCHPKKSVKSVEPGIFNRKMARIRNGGTPSHHPFIDGFSTINYKPSIYWGSTMETPMFTLTSNMEKTRCKDAIHSTGIQGDSGVSTPLESLGRWLHRWLQKCLLLHKIFQTFHN